MIKRSKSLLMGLLVVVVALLVCWIISIFRPNIQTIGNIPPGDVDQIKATVNKFEKDRFWDNAKYWSFGRLRAYLTDRRDHPIVRIETESDNTVRDSLRETFRGDCGFILKQEGGEWAVTETLFQP